MIATLSDSYDDTNIRAAFTVAFSAFLRPSEFTWDSWSELSFITHISRGAVHFTNDGVLLYLPKSKTDQFRQGNNIAISPANDIGCPVTALRRLFQKYPKPNSEPLFSRILGPFNKQWITDNLTSTLLKAGYDPTIYSGHSFRRGAANSAVAAGIPTEEIKKMGRWKSNAFDKYLT
jgi:hypothetical protein